MDDRVVEVVWDTVPSFGRTPQGVTAILRPSAYAIVSDGAAQIAVVRTPLGLYLPGGGMEPGESPIETVIREVREECGLEARVGTWIVRAVDRRWSPQDRVHYQKRSTFVDARCTDFRGTGIEPDHELLWMMPDAAASELAEPSHRWAVVRWIAGA